jgi:hypothetical protein
MDKILLIDAQNSVYRASVGFGPGKNNNHKLCEECDDLYKIHMNTLPHCICGSNWDHIENKCESEPDQDNIVIFNFFRNLRPIIEMFSPDKCFFVLEGHPQFRYDLYAEYKANRIVKEASKKEAKQKISRCRDEIVRILQYFPVTICRALNYEADDTIATLCENLKEEDVTVLSSDTDYIQLLQRGYKKCQIYNPIKKEFMKAPNYLYVAWKSLAGDKSDNIHSIMKPKQVEKAMADPKVFQEFMSIEENRAKFNINRELIEFKQVPEEELIFTEGVKDFHKVKEEFAQLKFESIINMVSWAKYIKTFECLKY